MEQSVDVWKLLEKVQDGEQQVQPVRRRRDMARPKVAGGNRPPR
uniref:Uncharacterized protein n=1 Tax=Solanum tuberosum TaxID=4113 RepID=M1DCE3_SOLTU